MSEEWKNKLYFGDNLEILSEHVKDETVDLIYLDPPFNSKASYNVLFKEKNGTDSAAEITAFEDFWHWDEQANQTYHELTTEEQPGISSLLQALCKFLGRNDMMAYLTMMAIRLIELRRVLKPTGSIYLHCDPTASHYLKLVMDAVFDVRNFRNEIVWKRTSAHSDVKQGAIHLGRIHDVILWYTRADAPVRNRVYVPYSQAYIEKVFRYVDERGRRYQTQPLHAKQPGGDTRYEWKGQYPPTGRYWAFSKANMEKLDSEGRIVYSKTGVPRHKRYLDEFAGRPLQDLWDDITPVHNAPKERLGYPTQKPEALIERIISVSSNEGDLVLDPFCGCGTTVAVAERLGRRWIGVDITHLAIDLMRTRLRDSFGDSVSPYEVIGDPKDLASAAALGQHDPYQFEWWALGLVAARPAQDKKKGADKGVDGYIDFHDDDSGQTKRIIVQVKSGHVESAQVQALKGAMEDHEAVMAAFITLEEPTSPMKAQALSAGYYEPEAFPGTRYGKLQILTIEELLSGETLKYPKLAEATFKRAPKKSKRTTHQKSFEE